jgi:hypothetical protein
VRNATTSQPLPTESVTGGESEFFTSLVTARETLNNATRNRVYTRASDDSWRREIESLQRDLKKIESVNR